jgi:hypothetical protein
MSKQTRKGKFNKRGGANVGRREFEEPSFWGEKESESSDSGVENEPKKTIKIEESKNIIETFNPNDAPARNLKISELSASTEGKGEPGNRKEREAAEAARKKEAYFKLQMEGKTAQAKSDLARLAIIRKQREEAAKKRAEEAEAKARPSEAKESSMTAGKSIISKSLGKK